MTIATGKSLQALIQDFFVQHLTVERNASPNTISSYRDAFKLFLRYASELKGTPPEALSHAILDAEIILSFLRWLQNHRKSSPRTCNQRLAALKSFTRYVALVAPEHLERCRLIRSIPPLRVNHPAIEYLTEEEVCQLFTGVDGATPRGRRDQAILLLLYNTGARVQEIVNLNVGVIQREPIPFVRIQGKGRRQRTCPLWTRTVWAIDRMLNDQRTPVENSHPLFLNPSGRRLSRFGVVHLISKAQRKSQLQPKHARRITPHVLRHTTAMHLLQSGVDITTIAAWLGHAQLSTTHDYVEIDLCMKQAAIAADTTLPQLNHGEYPKPDIIDWLESFGRSANYVKSEATFSRRDNMLQTGFT